MWFSKGSVSIATRRSAKKLCALSTGNTFYCKRNIGPVSYIFQMENRKQAFENVLHYDGNNRYN